MQSSIQKPIYLYCKVAGLNFRPSEARSAFHALPAGAAITLVPEPDNKYDRHAIKLCLVQEINGGVEYGHHMGYVPKDLAPRVGAALRDETVDVSCVKVDANKLDLEIVFTPRKEEEVFQAGVDPNTDEFFPEPTTQFGLTAEELDEFESDPFKYRHSDEG